MIDFDRHTVKLLRFIRRQKNATAPQIEIQKYSDKISVEKEDIGFLLICLTKEGYLLAIKKDGFDTFDAPPYSTTQYTRFWITPRGKKLLEDQFADFWRFMIPTLISVAALIISAVSLIK